MGQIVRDARKQEGLTQQQLADKIGADRTWINRLEKGLLMNPGMNRLFDVFETLHLAMFLRRDDAAGIPAANMPAADPAAPRPLLQNLTYEEARAAILAAKASAGEVGEEGAK
nr:helix-turn-helix domain-containing protein [Bifidobacterium choloepi]